MLRFFVEGGMPMWWVLIIGLFLLGASIRYAVDREPVRLRLIVALVLVHLTSACHGLVLNLASLGNALSDPRRVPDNLFTRLLFTGLKNAFRPMILAFGLLGLALILVAIGAYRSGRRELAAARV